LTDLTIDTETALVSYTEARRRVAAARVELAAAQTVAAVGQEHRQRWVLAELSGDKDEAHRHEVSDQTLTDDQKLVANRSVGLNASIEEYDAAVRTLAAAVTSA
jgi:hypothetical protein